MAKYAFSTDWVTGFAGNWRTFLRPLIGRPNVEMLEIGSYEGRSTIWFLDTILTGEGSRITCVDGFWQPYGSVFDRNIAASGLGSRVRKLPGLSQVVLPGLPASSFDAIYIDGCHTEEAVYSDANESFRLAKPGGILIFDDYLESLDKPITERAQRAIDRFLMEHRADCRLLYKQYQVIARKLGPMARS